MTWLEQFPTIGDERLSSLRQTVDAGFLGFARDYGEALELMFKPLKQFLIGVEHLLSVTPWFVVLLGVLLVTIYATRSWKYTFWAVAAFIFIGAFGMWDNTMKTLAMILAATIITILIGFPLGILLSRSNRLEKVFNPVMDVMQTLPSFVYLIPVVMLLGIGRVPGLIAVIIYALPPMIRLTNLGLRMVPKELNETADSFGASTWQKIFQVQLPVALPTIMAGLNQTIMLALAMVVIAAMIGVPGLGQPVLRAINNQYFTLGILNGSAIVILAMLFDRVTQMYGKRLQKHLGAGDE